MFFFLGLSWFSCRIVGICWDEYPFFFHGLNNLGQSNSKFIVCSIQLDRNAPGSTSSSMPWPKDHIVLQLTEDERIEKMMKRFQTLEAFLNWGIGWWMVDRNGVFDLLKVFRYFPAMLIVWEICTGFQKHRCIRGWRSRPRVSALFGSLTVIKDVITWVCFKIDSPELFLDFGLASLSLLISDVPREKKREKDVLTITFDMYTFCFQCLFRIPGEMLQCHLRSKESLGDSGKKNLQRLEIGKHYAACHRLLSLFGLSGWFFLWLRHRVIACRVKSKHQTKFIDLQHCCNYCLLNSQQETVFSWHYDVVFLSWLPLPPPKKIWFGMIWVPKLIAKTHVNPMVHYQPSNVEHCWPLLPSWITSN